MPLGKPESNPFYSCYAGSQLPHWEVFNPTAEGDLPNSG